MLFSLFAQPPTAFSNHGGIVIVFRYFGIYYTVTQLTGYIGLEAVKARSSGYPTGQPASYSN